MNPGPDAPARRPDEVTGRRRLLLALRPRATRRQLLTGVLLAVFGFGLAVQVRATQDAGLDALRESDLVRILDDVTERSMRLQAEARELERTRDRLSSTTGGRRAALEEIRKRAETLGILAGTVPATGPGIELTIPDPRGQVGPEVILDAVQELRDAGAEAIQIGDVRIVASTYFTPGLTAGPDGGISVDGQLLRPPYRLIVIGEPTALATALAIPGGVLEVLHEKGSSPQLEQRPVVTVSALRPLTPPQYARPAPQPAPR